MCNPKVICTVGKFFKFRFQKWTHIFHLELNNKKLWSREGPKTKTTFWLLTNKAQEIKSNDLWWKHIILSWKDLVKGYNFEIGSSFIGIHVKFFKKLTNLWESKFGDFKTPLGNKKSFQNCFQKKVQNIIL